MSVSNLEDLASCVLGSSPTATTTWSATTCERRGREGRESEGGREEEEYKFKSEGSREEEWIDKAWEGERQGRKG